ncbi:hypothetical protein LS482_14660 [Sinomicrobium kalidii]|uniref:hypothetical protein n=1 Tax=Sinomicrobium kalidii TaxID=2900738 RepID=UPI001E37481F|nr:hypothetical protein [Sinomicrobium kalidii]UGU14930.1 hypothetical protein LS482_14660 [Sinomicrobium kalidii]
MANPVFIKTIQNQKSTMNMFSNNYSLSPTGNTRKQPMQKGLISISNDLPEQEVSRKAAILKCHHFSYLYFN